MAIVNNPLMKHVSGGLDKQLVYRQLGGKTIVSAYPDFSNRKLSAKQKTRNRLLAEATKAAQAVRWDPEQCAAAQVRLNITRNKVFTSIVKEYMKNALEAERSQED